MMKMIRLFLLAAAFSAPAALHSAPPPAVQMLPPEGEIQPGSTFEFRFPTAMVNPDNLGPAAEAPVVFSPALDGSFSWLSTRSGVFSPTGPLPLGTTWEARLRDGLKTAEGKPMADKFSARLFTPSFGVSAVSRGVWDDEQVAPDLEVKLAFRRPVAPDEGFFQFVDAAGQKIPARVRVVGPEDFFAVPAEGEDWSMRWKLLRDPSARAEEAGKPLDGRLVITPTTPLPAAAGWKLVVAAGLPSKDNQDKLTEPFEVLLGTVPPFILKRLEAANYINSGTALNLGFSTSLAPDITAENADEFFQLTPKPPGLTWEVDYGEVVARAQFLLGQDYTLSLAPGVVSSVGQPLDGPREQTFRFGPVPPRLYLPELTMAQILGGRRQLPVRSVNLASLHLKATLLPPDKAARALSTFKTNAWKYSDEEPIPTTELTGRVLWDETLPLPDPTIDRKQTTDIDWTKLLGGKKAGLVLLEVQGQPMEGVEGKTPAAQALVQLTDLGVLWQKAGSEVRAHIFSTATAQAVAGASAQVLDAEFKLVATNTTARDGSTILAYSATPAWLVVQTADDLCVMPMGPEAETLRMGDWFSGNWSVATDTPADLRALVFTDRPLYQPGETAHVKGLVRRMKKAGLAVEAEKEFNLVLLNPEFNEISHSTVTTDAQGAFDTEVALPASPLGNYTLRLLAGQGEPTAYTSLLIAEYQPDAFEVSLKIPAESPAAAPAPRALVDGRYFFGGNLTGAEVRWTLRYFRETFNPTGFGNFQFIGEEEEEGRPLTLRGEGKITGGQPLAIEPVLPKPELAPFRGVLTAEVTDLNQQTVSATAEFTREASAFYLGVARGDERVVRLGDEVPLQFIAVQPDEVPLDQPVDVMVTVLRSINHVVRVQGAGGAMTFRRETIEQPTLVQKALTVTPVKTRDGWIAGETASLRYKTTALGHHTVRVTAHDAAGNVVQTESSFYVDGPGETVWDYSSPYEIKLVPDKESYRPGDTARILVQTPIAGEAFVSIVRGDQILRDLRLPLTGNAPVIEVPIGEADAPDVSVSLVLLRGADASPRKFPAPEFRFGACTLPVEQPSAHLGVAIEPAKSSVHPGEEIAATITVTDDRGQPVAGAGVTFYAVDDGVLALSGFTRPEPADVFLAPAGNRVLTGLSLEQFLPEDLEDLRFSNKGYLIGGGGEGGPVALRENFPGTACWLPSLVTGADGKVTARFTAPDALTRYRLVAVAVSGPTASGSAESSVNIARPLMILPSLGQFANAGDQLIARAVIRNETGQAGRVEVALQSPLKNEKTSLDIPTGESRSVDFPLTLAEPGTLDLEWTATMQAAGQTFSDRVKTVLPVRSPMLQLRETYFSQLDGKTNDLLADVNPQLAEGRGEVAVTVANTRLASVGTQARFLAEYPYGCAEQTASALVPWIVMPVLGPVLPDFARDPEKIRRVTTTTVAGLFKFQTPEGGLAFWPGGRESSPFASAWAAIVVARAVAAGVNAPAGWPRLLEDLAKSLRGLSPNDATPRLTERVFAAYALALAGKPEASYHEELYRRRAELPAEARCVLALAIMQAKGPHEMVARLLREDKSAPADVSAYGGAARDRAIRLMAWVNHQPKNNEVARLLAEVLAFGPQNRDGTTQSSAWTLLALADYYAKIEQPNLSNRTAQGTIVSGPTTMPFAVDAKTPAFRQTIALTPPPPPTTLQVNNPAARPLYSETRFAVYPALGEQPPQDRGFTVSRSYRKIAIDGSLQPAEGLRVGDRIVVTLRVESTRPAFFVAIDDPLPSILEAVNPDFVSRESGEAGDSTPWEVSHREVRGDRVVYFCDALPAGAFTFSYLARVRMAGEAAAGATKAEAMYRPERFGSGAISHLTSQPANTP
ncbi:MAG: alpha-2-macroglobulin family protein [Chthoniobacterales bacterium]